MTHASVPEKEREQLGITDTLVNSQLQLNCEKRDSCAFSCISTTLSILLIM